MSERGLAALRVTRRWALILGIMIAVGIVVATTLAILAGIAGFAFLMPYPLSSPVRIFYAAVMGVTLLIYVPFCLLALQYQHHLRTVVNTGDAPALEHALWAQRRFWTLGGVIVIAYTALCVLAMIGAIVAAIVVAAHQVR